jgi:hypothetical protein
MPVCKNQWVRNTPLVNVVARGPRFVACACGEKPAKAFLGCGWCFFQRMAQASPRLLCSGHVVGLCAHYNEGFVLARPWGVPGCTSLSHASRMCCMKGPHSTDSRGTSLYQRRNKLFVELASHHRAACHHQQSSGPTHRSAAETAADSCTIPETACVS